MAATLLLDDRRRTPTQVDATAAGHSPATAEGTTRRRWTWLLPVAAALAAVTTAAVLAIELRDADLAAALARTDLTWVAVAIGIFGLSILSAAYNLMGFSALRLRLAPTLARPAGGRRPARHHPVRAQHAGDRDPLPRAVRGEHARTLWPPSVRRKPPSCSRRCSSWRG